VSAPPFRLGVNYWPARTAMGWWRAFDAAETRSDFARIAASGFDSVRIFLTWEDFQPTPSRVDTKRVRDLVSTLELAATAGLSVMPTLFTGHMSGVNWVPPWALGGDGGDTRFRVISGGLVTEAGLGNWYSDPAIARAQCLLAREVAGALAGHSALWAWDLGNENSNCVIPPHKAAAKNWLFSIADAIRSADSGAKITLGLHMEDLEQDRNLGPREAATACDFLTMHGYPGYAKWSAGPTDERLLPFLTHVTRWLAGGAPVLFSEFGVPTFRSGDPDSEQATRGSTTAVVAEDQAAAYIERALDALLACGSTGAMLWCYADYARAIWAEPPLDAAVHERSFGQWRADGSRKPATLVVEAFTSRQPRLQPPMQIPEATWIDIDAATFYEAPAIELPRLYRRYCGAL